MRSFVYDTPLTPARVIFGTGTLCNLAREINNLGCSKALILTTRGQANHGERIKADLGEFAVGLYANATMHTPVNVTEEALQIVERLGADPATSVVGQTVNGVKTIVKAVEILPRTIIYDASLTFTLPPPTSIVSGLNAIAHAVEALYSAESNPITDMMSEKGILSLVRSLPRIHLNALDEGARSDALLGAWLCGNCLASVRMGLHHKLCHVLGGAFNLPHAETHAVVLPHVVAYNTLFAKLPVSKLANLLGSNVAKGLYDFGLSLGAPCSLKQLGMREQDLEKVAELAVNEARYPNPAPLDKHKIWLLLKDAYDGKRPT